MLKIKGLFGKSRRSDYKCANLDEKNCDSNDSDNEESKESSKSNTTLWNFDSDCDQNYTTVDYINFLNNELLTEKYKSYSDIMNYTDGDIEDDCRFIQWIFPLAEKSAFASNVPIINLTELKQAIARDKTIIKKLIKSYVLMMNHWGLLENDKNKVELLNGHNALRFSRMLQSLIYHGQVDMAWEAYRLISQYFGNSDDSLNILHPKMMSMDGVCMDAWKYHLLKALKEVQ